jgi:hypothetical protein
MFIVHHSYSDKADKYVRMNGTINFAGGGSFFDDLYALKNYGIVPEAIMNGLNYGEEKHKHGELDALTEAYVKVIVSNRTKNYQQHGNRALMEFWMLIWENVPKIYLGSKEYTPLSYFQSLGINPDDYVSLTSFTHHPFYTKFAIEIPDNWRWGESYNLPLDEFMSVFDYAVNQVYTIAWAYDVIEKGFTRNGIAVNPETKLEKLPGSDQQSG